MTAGGRDDNLERAGRILARAFGYGDAWNVVDRALNNKGEDRHETVIDATTQGQPQWRIGSLAIRHEVRASSDKREPRIDGVPEFKHFSAERHLSEVTTDEFKAGIVRHVVGPTSKAITPRMFMDERALIALANLNTLAQAVLLLYALGDSQHWSLIERCARRCLPKGAHAGIDEAMFRTLYDCSDKGRAIHHTMRELTYKNTIRPAQRLFSTWLQRAADEYAQSIERASRLVALHQSQT